MIQTFRGFPCLILWLGNVVLIFHSTWAWISGGNCGIWLYSTWKFEKSWSNFPKGRKRYADEKYMRSGARRLSFLAERNVEKRRDWFKMCSFFSLWKKKKTSLKAQFLCSGFLCLVHNLLIWRIAEHWKKIIVSFRVRYVMNWKVLNHSMLFSPSNPRFQTSYHHSTSCFVDKRTALVSNL